MHKIIWSRLSALVLVCLAGLLLALPVAAEGAGAVEFPAKLTLSDVPADAAPYSFTLKAQNVENPMPADAEGDTKTITINDAGTFGFGNIEFANIGEYTYTVTQTPGSSTSCTYDSRVYTATVYVQWKNEVGGPVNTTLVLTVSGNNNKPSEIEFKNVGTGPKPTATPTLAPTATPTLAPTATTKPTPTATTKPTPTATTKPVPTATTKPTPTATTKPAPTSTPNSTATPVPTVAPLPSETPAPTSTPEPTTAPTATPVPIGTGDGSTGGTDHGGSMKDEEPEAGSDRTVSTADDAALTSYLRAHGLLPQTSDDEPLLLLAVLAGGSLFAFVVLFIRKRRKNNDNRKN